MSETETNPVAETAAAASTPGVDGQGPTAQTSEDIDTEAYDRMPAPEEDGETDPAEEAGDESAKPADTQAADDDEEVELSDGRKVKAPKELALGYLRQGDYTQKTQALAEDRRQHAEAVSTWETQQAESLKTFRAEHVAIANAEAQLGTVEGDLAKYRTMTPGDWANLKAQDPDTYRAHSENFEELRRYKISLQETLDGAKTELTAKETKAREAGDKARAAAIAEGFQKANATLTKEVPGWTPQRFNDVEAFATKELGVKTEELRETTDPRVWKTFDRLMKAEAELAKLRTANKQQTAATNNDKAQTAKPAARPAGGAASRGVNDDLGTSAWMVKRNAQLARKAS